jgi:hypothetical protein
MSLTLACIHPSISRNDLITAAWDLSHRLLEIHAEIRTIDQLFGGVEDMAIWRSVSPSVKELAESLRVAELAFSASLRALRRRGLSGVADAIWERTEDGAREIGEGVI